MSSDVWFATTDQLGDEVSLLVTSAEQLAGLVGAYDTYDEESFEAEYDDEGGEWDTTHGMADDVYFHSDLDEPEMIGPVWWVERPDCDNDEEDDSTDCRCGIVDLVTALTYLTPQQRQTAVEAHVRSIRALSNHLDGMHSLVDGDENLGEVCVHCFVGGADHHDHLEEELTIAATDLAAAIACYAMTFTVGAPLGDLSPTPGTGVAHGS